MSRLFIYLKFTRVSSIVYWSLNLNYIKETNWLINEGMCVLLFDVFKHLLLRKTDVLKTCRKSKFLGKKIWRNALALKSKRCKVYSGKRLLWHYYLQQSFVSQKPCFRFLLNQFCSGDERLLSELLRKWSWFQGHNERFPK